MVNESIPADDELKTQAPALYRASGAYPFTRAILRSEIELEGAESVHIPLAPLAKQSFEEFGFDPTRSFHAIGAAAGRASEATRCKRQCRLPRFGSTENSASWDVDREGRKQPSPR